MANDIAAWYGEYGPMVFRRCWCMLCPETYRDAKAGRFDKAPDEVKDAVTDVFLKLSKKRQSEIDFLSSYIYRTATNVCLNRLRKRNKKVGGVGNPFSLEKLFPNGEAPLPVIDGSYEQVEAEMTTEDIKAIILKEKKEKKRVIWYMHYIDEEEVNEIKRTVGLKDSRIYKIIADFKNEVRSKLERVNK